MYQYRTTISGFDREMTVSPRQYRIRELRIHFLAWFNADNAQQHAFLGYDDIVLLFGSFVLKKAATIFQLPQQFFNCHDNFFNCHNNFFKLPRQFSQLPDNTTYPKIVVAVEKLSWQLENCRCFYYISRMTR